MQKPDKKSKDYTSATIGVPVTLGHRTCIPKATFPKVPKKMGWLWTARNVPAHAFDPAWRPGAVLRGLFGREKNTRKRKITKESTVHSVPSIVKPPKKVQKKPSQRSIVNKPKKSFGNLEDSYSESDSEVKPMFLVQKKEGGIKMTLQQIKNPGERKVTDYPYDETIPPFSINIYDEAAPREVIENKKRRRIKQQKLERRILFEQAIDSICRQLYETIDKAKIQEEADLGNRCPCSYIQDYVLKYLSRAYSAVKAEADTKKLRIGERNILESVVLEEGILRTKPRSPVVLSSDEEWTVEFTPPCAKYDPYLKEVKKKDAEQQTMKIKTMEECVNLISKSNISFKGLSQVL